MPLVFVVKNMKNPCFRDLCRERGDYCISVIDFLFGSKNKSKPVRSPLGFVLVFGQPV